MSGHEHYPDGGQGWSTAAGTRATCAGCRRTITFIAGFDRRRDHWRASGPFGKPLPVSRRCPSRNPAVGYRSCDMQKGHPGTCREGGYVWWRGRGRSRPSLVTRPAWDQP